MGHLILDSKTWGFQIQIILIQITLSEQLAPEVEFDSVISSVQSLMKMRDCSHLNPSLSVGVAGAPNPPIRAERRSSDSGQWRRLMLLIAAADINI